MTAGQARIAARFAALKQAGRGGLIPFITAGDRGAAATAEILRQLPAAGADVIELGMPFSDPMADGPAIQAASVRALKAGMTLRGVLDLVADFRSHDGATPMILMGYVNPILRYGVEAFLDDAVAAGVDGLLLVDLPPEEDAELGPQARDRGLATIRLATPTSDAKRLPSVLQDACGFLYYVAVAGITGTRSAPEAVIAEAMQRLRPATDLPIAVGFGIRTPEAAASMARLADAAVVGSAIVERMAAAETPGAAIDAALDLVRDLAAAIRAA